MPRNGVLEALEGVGHFVHIEQPRRIADLILSFIGSPAGATNTGAATTGAES
jgi:pimeloyl-ACP methyl ester carboxylesterase